MSLRFFVEYMRAYNQNKWYLHVFICPRSIRRVHAGVDEPIVPMLQRRNIDREYLLDVVRKVDLLDLDTAIWPVVTRAPRRDNMNAPEGLLLRYMRVILDHALIGLVKPFL